MRKVWVAVMLVMLAALIYVLHIYIFIEPDTDDMANENLIAVQRTDNQEASAVPENTAIPSPSAGSVTAQSVLNPQGDSTAEEALFYEVGLFSWGADVFKPENLASLYLTTNVLGIDEIYQDFGGVAAEDETAAAFAHELALLDVDLYMLTGDSTWANDDSGSPMISEIERADAFRTLWGTNALAGIVFDIEPYGSDRWDDGDREELLENFILGMKKAYLAAQEKDLRVILCVPTWYDKNYEAYFKLLAKHCDEISVMNYVKADEYINMVGEVEYARALDKDVACVFEFQQPGVHDLTERNTYYNDGIEAAVNSFEELYRDFGYEKLKFAYHYLTPISEMLKDR